MLKIFFLFIDDRTWYQPIFLIFALYIFAQSAGTTEYTDRICAECKTPTTSFQLTGAVEYTDCISAEG